MSPRKVGTKEEMFGLDTLRILPIAGRPTTMPKLGPEEVVVCLFDRFIHVAVWVCETLADMQYLYDQMAAGMGKSVQWRAGIVAEVVVVDLTDKFPPAE